MGTGRGGTGGEQRRQPQSWRPGGLSCQTVPKLVGQNTQNTATTSPGALWVMSTALVRSGDGTQDDLQPSTGQDNDSYPIRCTLTKRFSRLWFPEG